MYVCMYVCMYEYLIQIYGHILIMIVATSNNHQVTFFLN
jgi:hypothetical protein